MISTHNTHTHATSDYLLHVRGINITRNKYKTTQRERFPAQLGMIFRTESSVGEHVAHELHQAVLVGQRGLAY